MPEGAWFESFFSGLWLEAQRAIGSAGVAGDAALVERALGLAPGLAPGAALLDAPCGQGRISLELAARGYRVTGIDRTPVLLAEARTAARERDLDVTFAEHDLRDLPFEGAFDAALCFWGSFGYFDDVGNVEQARAAARALRPGGRYLIDTHVLESLLPIFEPRTETQVGDIRIVEDRRWDATTGRVECDWTITRGARTEEFQSSIRVYSYRELVQVLQMAGFEHVEGLASPGLGPFDVGSRRLCAVAMRAE